MKLTHTSQSMLNHRASGVLLHITSLPGRYGIGDLGPAAYAFVDFLKSAGQSWWQMFPIGPEGFGHSPYQSLSVYAGNSLMISLEKLVEDGLLAPEDLKKNKTFSANVVDYKKAQQIKDKYFDLAFKRFEKSHTNNLSAAFKAFCLENKKWLDSYSLYRALRWENTRKPWWDWPSPLRSRQPEALRQAKKRLHEKVRYFQFLQFLFYRQWKELKDYCGQNKIGIIGDAPIFVAEDSADVWCNPELFHLNKAGRPTIVAGVPPDYFSKTGQRWGNPIYRWDAHRKTGYRWWVERTQKAFQLFDAVRLDHFIGFYNYWAIPAEDPTAERGRWQKGPGADFFQKLFKKLGPVQFIAEDLGVLTNPVKVLRDQFNLPGMRVLQFAFGADPEAFNYRPHNFPENCIAYTGTHDNDTAVGWFNEFKSKTHSGAVNNNQKEREFALAYLNSDGKEIHWDFIRAALMSRARTVIIPVQDLLGLGSEARMNRPGTSEGNWVWKLSEGELSDEISSRLYCETQIFGRLKK